MMSLQRRVTFGIGAVLAAVLLALWFTLGALERQLAEDYVRSRLEHDAESLLAALTIGPEGLALTPAAVGPVYMRPYSGHYFLVESEGHLLRSRSMWDFDMLREKGAGNEHHYRTTGPRHQSLQVFERRYTRYGRSIETTVAEDITPIEDQIARHQGLLGGVLAAALFAALLLQWYAVRRGLAPLQRLKQEVAAVQRGKVALVAASAPSEVAPLVEEINHLLRLISQRLERSRNALGDLAHALKTPLSLIVNTAEDPQAQVPPAARQNILEETGRIRALVERELRRARLAGGASPGQRFQPGEELPHLARAIRGIYGEKALDLAWDLPVEIRFAADRDDMLELLGNLLDNAAKWASARIHLVIADEPTFHLTVEDDGPGCPEEGLGQLAHRGVRLDEASPGTGLGLSIVKAIVDEYGGTLNLSRSEGLGGFRVDVHLPIVREM